MLIALCMLAAWQTQGGIYKEPFTKAAEATYVGSETKNQIDPIMNKLVRTYPTTATILPAAYALGFKKEIRITSHRITPFKNTVTTYQVNQSRQSGSIIITWGF